MPITDLTGTKWVMDNSVAPAGISAQMYDLAFQSNLQSFTSFRGKLGQYIIYDRTTVYSDDNGWDDEAYKTIEITGGTDTTNSDLISWLQENATQIIEPEPVQAVSSSFKSIAITEHETYITLEFNGEEYDLELSTPLSSPSASKIIFGSFAQVSIADNVLSIGDKSYELVANAPTPTLISFTTSWASTIHTYQAEEGMTWADFIASTYNTDNTFFVTDNPPTSSSLVHCIDNNHGLSLNGHSVTIYDEIVDGANYSIVIGD